MRLLLLVCRAFLLLSLAVLPARAQEEAPPPEPTRFRIEKITVEGPNEAPANIVRAETLLREGETYSEEQLRQAVYRVHRLPFVLDASFSLRKGSERGAYELVVEVLPARWFFYDHSLRAYFFDDLIDLGEGIENTNASFHVGGLAGARLFVGRSGVLFGALDVENGAQIGFTQYDLFGRGILASAGVSRNVCCVQEALPLGLDPTFTFWGYDGSTQLSLSLSMPLGGRQSFQVALNERRGEAWIQEEILPINRRQDALLSGGDLLHRRAEAKWVYDTSDDPLLPSRGVTLSAGLEASRFTASDIQFTFEGEDDGPVTLSPPAYEAEQVVAAVSGVQHWSVTPRQTVSLSGRVAAGRSSLENLRVGQAVQSFDLDSYGGSLGAQHAVTLKRSRGSRGFMDMRWETGVEVGAERVSRASVPNPLQRLQLSTGFVFRHQWGRIRAFLTYLDLGEIF